MAAGVNSLAERRVRQIYAILRLSGAQENKSQVWRAEPGCLMAAVLSNGEGGAAKNQWVWVERDDCPHKQQHANVSLRGGTMSRIQAILSPRGERNERPIWEKQSGSRAVRGGTAVAAVGPWVTVLSTHRRLECAKKLFAKRQAEKKKMTDGGSLGRTGGETKRVGSAATGSRICRRVPQTQIRSASSSAQVVKKEPSN